ncbi:MAG: hypothetical protein EA388_12345 [Nitriliruptor sp.]|nr:MAG: hypothetical protein EA388_12345 [Nitriliruptor sp.]
MSTIALVQAAPGVGTTTTSTLVARAVAEHGVTAVTGTLGDGSIEWSEVQVAVLVGPVPDPFDRERFLAQVQEIADVTDVWNPVEVLRWNTHRSYLLELEERGAPIVPTAWVAAGDQLDLAALLAAREWSDVLVKPAVSIAGASLRVRASVPRTDGVRPRDGGPPAVDLVTGQRHLDRLLATGDALLQPFLGAVTTVGRRSVVVVDGQVSHTIRQLPSGTDGPQVIDDGTDPELSALARWVVDATGVDLLAARVDLIDDELGAPQVVEVEAALPELHLDVVPSAATVLASAILRRLG